MYDPRLRWNVKGALLLLDARPTIIPFFTPWTVEYQWGAFSPHFVVGLNFILPEQGLGGRERNLII